MFNVFKGVKKMCLNRRCPTEEQLLKKKAATMLKVATAFLSDKQTNNNEWENETLTLVMLNIEEATKIVKQIKQNLNEVK